MSIENPFFIALAGIWAIFENFSADVSIPDVRLDSDVRLNFSIPKFVLIPKFV